MTAAAPRKKLNAEEAVSSLRFATISDPSPRRFDLMMADQIPMPSLGPITIPVMDFGVTQFRALLEVVRSSAGVPLRRLSWVGLGDELCGKAAGQSR